MANPLPADDDIWDVFRILKEERQRQGGERRHQADLDYEVARQAAERFAMRLLRHSQTHYSLRHQKGWILNIYPGNRRLYRHPHTKARSPFLQLPDNWTLIDVVEACARIEEKQRLKAEEE